MDMFDIDNVKVEKAKAIFHYNLLNTFQTLFRVVELFLLIILLSWTSSRLPFAVKLSGQYFRLLISILANPFSIFIIGNVIVLCLLFKSGHLSTNSPINITSDENHEIFQEHVTGINFLNPVNAGDEMQVPVVKTEEIVFEDKETIYEEISDVTLTHVVKIDKVEKHLMRVKSENLHRKVHISKNLRRSKTEKCRGILNFGEAAAAEEEEEKEEVHVFDALSNEEFQNAIETFIAKQVKFREAEKLDIVLHTLA